MNSYTTFLNKTQQKFSLEIQANELDKMLFIISQLKKKIPIDILKNIRYLLRKLALSISREYFNLEAIVRKKGKIIDENQNQCILNFSSEEIIKVDAPPATENIPPEIKQRTGKFVIPKPFVFTVNNAELVGPYATGFTSQGNLIIETTVPSFYGLEQGVSIRALAIKNFSKPSPIQLEAACSLVNVWCHNYFHWIIDCLSRIEGIEYYQAKTGCQPKLIVSSNPTLWQKESLRLLGYQPENCVCWNNSRMAIKQLIVLSFRRHSLLELSPQACRWLRQRILSNLPSYTNSEHSFSPRVLISRRKASGRKIINEDEVTEALIPYGFVPYILEEMSFSDQVRLFSQAEIVLGPHGAGLVNMIFSQNLTVIELFGEPINGIFFTLAKALDFKYAFLRCESIIKKFNSKRNDMVVEIPKLKKVVTEILSNNA